MYMCVHEHTHTHTALYQCWNRVEEEEEEEVVEVTLVNGRCIDGSTVPTASNDLSMSTIMKCAFVFVLYVRLNCCCRRRRLLDAI